MSEAFLNRLTDAYRRELDPDLVNASRVRRVLLCSDAPRPRRRAPTSLALAAALAFVGSVALASSPRALGSAVRDAWRWLAAEQGGSKADSSVAAPSTRTSPRTARRAVVAVPGVVSAWPPAARPPTDGADPSTVTALPEPPEPPKTVPARRVVPSRLDDELVLYRAAHEAHFGSRDSASALSAWDAYLRGFPRGRLAPEARYNRALALLALGRRADAHRALEPFARGDYGGYRRTQASALLRAQR